MSDLPPIEKVTALITRDSPRGRELLVFFRPDDGFTQIPAGTVEEGEAPDDALLREVAEETSLTAVRVIRKLDSADQELAANARIVLETHPLCIEPGGEAVDGLSVRRGLMIYFQGAAGEWTRALYREYSYDPATKQELTRWEKIGWLPTRILSPRIMRHFYHLTPTEPTPERWIVEDPGDDGRVLELYWVPLEGETSIAQAQVWWLERFHKELAEG